MGFKEVLDLDANMTISLGGRDKKTGKPNPTQAEGYFLGSKQVVSKRAKTGFSYLHILQTEEGNLGIWGKTDLDRKIRSVPAGAMTRITQSGMQVTENGDMYKFRVEVDADNSIDVSSISSSDRNDTQDVVTSDTEDHEEEAALDEPNLVKTAPPKVAASTPTSSQQSRVQALLNRSTRAN